VAPGVVHVMPELPEFEYTSQKLRAAIVGTIIRDVSVFWERTVRCSNMPDFIAGVAGKRRIGASIAGRYCGVKKALQVVG
jgi:formamidopyrimidine-DNA glycosylase